MPERGPVIQCAEALKPLLSTVPGVGVVVAHGDPLPPYDAHCPLLSLPRIFETTVETIPGPRSYMSVSRTHRAAAQARIDARRGKLNVGLAWAGSKEHSNDRNRSCPLTVLEPLLALQDIAWFSLQQGEAGEELNALADPHRVLPLPPGTPLLDTAALISELDLVISVDTSVAHLAGALGKRCWLMLPFAPDWRWLLSRSDTPWYPATMLYRQPKPRDWPAVADRLVADLRALLT